MTRRSQKIGKQGQDIAFAALRMRGVRLLHKIATPVLLIPHPRERGYFRVIWEQKVAGDHRGVMPDGTSVLAEVKTVTDHNLRWSDFLPHQPIGLTAHAEYAISLVVWVHASGVYVMRWPIEDFRPGHSIMIQDADRFDWLTSAELERHTK
jgi:hypothetical protein